MGPTRSVDRVTVMFVEKPDSVFALATIQLGRADPGKLRGSNGMHVWEQEGDGAEVGGGWEGLGV